MSTTPLLPAVVFDCFAQICAVPRPSKHEEQIQAFLEAFAHQHQLPVRTDAIGNVLITKAATPGYEHLRTTVIQSHMDMVCEKNADVSFDFTQDAIRTEVRGEWLHAQGTTLGADDGIGMAMALALLQSDDVAHGPIECLFTKDEETGLTGAKELQPDFLTGDYLINLDSEDEGQLFVSCAGGAGTEGVYTIAQEQAPQDYYYFTTQVSGLLGGHSGDDINKNRANANKILLRFLQQCVTDFGYRLSDIQAGGLHNAIPREAMAIGGVPTRYKEQVRIALNHLIVDLEEAYAQTEQHIQLTLQSVPTPDLVYAEAPTQRMIASLFALFNGVYAMSTTMPGLVETSSNLASVRSTGTTIKAITSQRSAVNSERRHMSAIIRAGLSLGGAQVTTGDGYPGWRYNPDSTILHIATQSYERLFGKAPQVLAIHAGLECGLIGEKYPALDMISFGPTLRGVHSPDERLLIPTVLPVWQHLLDILVHIPARD